MFALIAIGNQTYVEPSAVLQSIVDDKGEQIKIGDECDISQFNEIFLSRIQDAITSQKKTVAKEDVKEEFTTPTGPIDTLPELQ